jgi:Icc-related predicted phosphoesterase
MDEGVTTTAGGKSVRLAAVGDLHCTRTSKGVFKGVIARMAEDADILVLCGDLTDYGLPEEAHVLAEELKAAEGVPTVAVLGNHDFESGQQDAVKDVLAHAGVRVLDGEVCEFLGVGFAGVKGFLGGFETRMLQAWGEQIIKAIVHEAVEETLKLETALARLDTAYRIAVMHYSPIRATVEGEPTEVFPFLGSSRLEEPLHRFPVTAVFHGHAHYGSPEGHTTNEIPVYNVAMPLLRHVYPERPPFRLFAVEVEHDR